MKLCKKNNRRGLLSLSGALLGQLNSSKPGEAIALQITGSLQITRYQFLQISHLCINRRNQQIMQICSQ